jgi:hypothetical protein
MSLQPDVLSEGVLEDGASGYEPPVLVPLGNLHDLLAAGGTANCDGSGDLTPGVGTSPDQGGVCP